MTVLDEEAGTYRYHQLIKEVLQAELHARDPAREQQLHLTAATYLAESGRAGPAARHLLAAGDPAAAFHLLSERVVRDFFVNPTVGSALDLDEVQPDPFAGAPEILVPLAVELLMRGAFERGSRAFTLAQDTGVDPGQQPELALRLALALTLLRPRRPTGRIFGSPGPSAKPGGPSWRPGRLAARPRRPGHVLLHLLGPVHPSPPDLAAVASAHFSPPPVTEVLCPGITSQVALAEGALAEAATLAHDALAAARRLGLDRHYIAFRPCAPLHCSPSSDATWRPPPA